MSSGQILRLGTVKDVGRFQEHLRSLHLDIPCDAVLAYSEESPLLQPLQRAGLKIGNRIVVQPMEGWDGTPDGRPSERTIRRWKRFGRSGAKLVWGCEAVAVTRSGRANPNQLVAAEHTKNDMAHLREALIAEHRLTTGSDSELIIGLQLTHSGRYCRPNANGNAEPKILYRHPVLDRRLKLPRDFPVLTDGEIEAIVGQFHAAAKLASDLGFDFVDIKHCHGYLGHEFLSAHTRKGKYGGSFENRTRFLREVVQGIRCLAPALRIGVRLSAFDTIPYHPDPGRSVDGVPGPGVPEAFESLLPYRWGFGVNPDNPVEIDLREPIQFLGLLEELKIPLVNLTAGSPYYNPHIQRPALYPPSDGYLPPEDPLAGVARQMRATKDLKSRFPGLIIVGTAYSYLQEFLPNVAQAAIRESWTDCVGLGRMVLSYPRILWDAVHNQPMLRKLVCRTFSDCTTAPRNGLPSGCYPLDDFYKHSESSAKLREIKTRR